MLSSVFFLECQYVRDEFSIYRSCNSIIDGNACMSLFGKQLSSVLAILQFAKFVVSHLDAKCLYLTYNGYIMEA